jgi:hypothetical protein
VRYDTNPSTSCRRARWPTVCLPAAAWLLAGCASSAPIRGPPAGGTPWSEDRAIAIGAGPAGTGGAGADVQGESAGPGAPAAGAEEAAAADGLAVSGSLVTRYLGRQSGGDQDHDLYTLLSVDLGDEQADDWTGHVMGRLSKDLDGDTGGEDSPFFSLEDTYDHSLNGRLYEAYADARDTDLAVLRLGRQTLYETPEFVRLDGARIETAPAGDDKHAFGLYAGRPVHEYESSPDGDQALGAYAVNRPWKGARARLDYMHLEDEVLLGTEANDLWAVSLDQGIDRQFLLHGDYALLENRPREYTVRGTWVDPEEGTLVQVSHYELLSTQRMLVEELDPFFETLVEYFPFRQERVLASTSLDEDLDVSGGVDVRRVDDDDDVSEFNRDFQRYHATGTLHDVLVPDVSVSLTGETWNANGSDETTTWGLDVTRVYSEDVRASIGSYYALFKNDFLLGTERQDVRTYYVLLRLRQDPRLSWSFGYDYEDADIDDFQSLTVKASWRF